MKRQFRTKQQGFAIIFVTITLLLFMSILASTSMRKVLFATKMRDDLQDVYLAADNCADSLSQYVKTQIYAEHFGGASNLYVLDESDAEIANLAQDEENVVGVGGVSNYCLPGIWANFAASNNTTSVLNSDIPTIFRYNFAQVGGVGSGADVQLSYHAIRVPDTCVPSMDAAMLGGGAGAASYTYYWTLSVCQMPYVNRRNNLDAIAAGITPAFQRRKFSLITLPD